jgi:DNA replication protein DnaC
MTDEPQAVEALVDKVLGIAREAKPRPAPEPAVEDPDVEEQRRANREAAWRRLVPPVYGDPTLARFASGDGGRYPEAPADVLADLTAWAENPTTNLVILGPVGTGKTFAAWAALRRSYGRRRDVFGIGAVDLLDALRPGGDPTVAERTRSAEILLVDDLGAHRGTEWTDERLYALIHHRWEQAKPIVLTANVADGDELLDLLGERAYSRVTGAAVAVALYGPDRRKL